MGAGKGRTTAGVEPGSTDGRIRPGRNTRSGDRCCVKRFGWLVQSGVSMFRNLGRWALGNRGRVSSMEYMRDRD